VYVCVRVCMYVCLCVRVCECAHACMFVRESVYVFVMFCNFAASLLLLYQN